MVNCRYCDAEVAFLPGGETKTKPHDVLADFIESDDFMEMTPEQIMVFDVVLFLKDSLENTVFHSSVDIGRRLYELDGYRVLVVENDVNSRCFENDGNWTWLMRDSFPVGVPSGHKLASGEKQFDEGKYEEALSIFKKLAALVPGNYENWNNLGVVLSHMGMFNEASICLKKALLLKDDYPEALENLVKLAEVSNCSGVIKE